MWQTLQKQKNQKQVNFIVKFKNQKDEQDEQEIILRYVRGS